MAENARTVRTPDKVAMAFTRLTSEWRKPVRIQKGREEIKAVPHPQMEQSLIITKSELWAFTDNRIAVRFE